MIIDGNSLSLQGIFEELKSPTKLSLNSESVQLVRKSREVVEHILETGDTVYGVNTGFGKLANQRISSENLRQLQVNLLRSHAAGTGGYLSQKTVRLILLLKINSLLRGYSGIRLEVIEALINLYNNNLTPAVRERGSVGASGDLAPLADLALPLIGEGQFLMDDDTLQPASEILKRHKLQVVELKEKEGLSLINGTQVSTALAIESLEKIRDLFFTISATGAFSTEVMLGTDTAFRKEIQKARNQPGQIYAGELLYSLMANSGYRDAHLDCDRVQDFYSIRCMPQVHGSLYDLIQHAERILTQEANSTTDNPVTLIDENVIVSGGNFHAAPIAHTMDYLAIALSDVVAMSERRIAAFQETSQSNLPMFLMQEAGLNSGFMIAHVTAAALASENKSLSHPASVDSIPTSANQEDHVSMAPNAGHQLRQVVSNSSRIIAIELMCAAQAKDLNPQYHLAPASKAIYNLIRLEVPYLEVDGPLSAHIESIHQIVSSGAIAEIVAKHLEEQS
ncbi:MAG: histidine ammonia-lyase [Candidatus Marinimicrobia bacterium]|jgi:histidine ammonia-lyase|nr:histidine ammonia-lyase [Candidatus Neomarinimicrobiota bacterium]MBT3630396.1 histidine ammonia-lyase [Candidatus Neomarinimicrobiota bacterium]MBT3823715.1 histidine ammonia-lyase [Candidatus Neomarinimicrobiota bacterium]MBT4131936.1 histidine ammonia-lyase [Candidatus Neomarinimicrobiota bacterium]MBT4294662.1 histidine ammonia-lyase [Candidatus Neomarinimicrobiota bacterium]